MCGIYIYPQALEPNPLTEESVKKRGPDFYSKVTRGGYVFNHALLSLTGEFTPQPYDSEEFALLFNGEIYNYDLLGSFKSELECLASLYRSCYLDFIRLIDGEFVIVVFDWRRAEVIVVTDVFGTKPIFANILEQGIELASVPSVRKGRHSPLNFDFPPNSATVLDLGSLKIKRRFNNHIFNLDQDIAKYDFWVEAFFNSIKKRIPKHNTDQNENSFFLGLSSGYDSGCIAAALTNLNVKYTAYSIVNDETVMDILQRSQIVLKCGNHYLFRDTRATGDLGDGIEYFEFEIFSDDGSYKEAGTSTTTDQGARGLAFICSRAKKSNFRITLSGSGADEIYSDYGFLGRKIYPHSNFGGHFKDHLESYFPWPSFFGSTMRAYLMKEELVAGSFGIEARYPFLDTQLTQAWLSLEPRLKNSNYKSALKHFLNIQGFPNREGVKYGF